MWGRMGGMEGGIRWDQPDLKSRTATCPMQKQMKCLVSWVTQLPKLRPTTQCQVGLYFLSNSFLMQAAISFSMLNFSSPTLAQSIASCCISSFMSACLITAFRYAVDIQIKQIKYKHPPSTHTNTHNEQGKMISNPKYVAVAQGYVVCQERDWMQQWEKGRRQKYMDMRSGEQVGFADVCEAALDQQQLFAVAAVNFQHVVGRQSYMRSLCSKLSSVPQNDADASRDELVQQNLEKVFGQYDELPVFMFQIEFVVDEFVLLKLL